MRQGRFKSEVISKKERKIFQERRLGVTPQGAHRMENKRKTAVLEILNYWKITEFLGQTDIPQESTDNKKLIKNIKNGKEVKAEKIEVFFDLPVLASSDIDLEMILGKDRDDYLQFPSVGDEIHFCLGKIERNTVVDYLEKFIEDTSLPLNN